MTDCKRVFKDNKAFLRKLRSYLKKKNLPESKIVFKFIAVVEPQGENHDLPSATNIYIGLRNGINFGKNQ